MGCSIVFLPFRQLSNYYLDSCINFVLGPINVISQKCWTFSLKLKRAGLYSYHSTSGTFQGGMLSSKKNYEYQILLNGKKLDWNYYVLTAQGSKLIWLIWYNIHTWSECDTWCHWPWYHTSTNYDTYCILISK